VKKDKFATSAFVPLLDPFHALR